MSDQADVAPRAALLRAGCVRGLCFFLFWLTLAGFKVTDVAVGVVAAAIAAWVSIRLMPPEAWRFRPVKLARYLLRFWRQSVTAGIDVAWRALDPRMPLRPGVVNYRTHLPAGATLDAFCTVSSLLPGTLPCGQDSRGGLAIHCLDATQPVAEQLAAEEGHFVEALGESVRHG